MTDTTPAAAVPPPWLVVMGVAGCGKTSVGRAAAVALGLPLIEGDGFHPPANVEKMRAGIPLDDEDRAGWLDRLADELAAHPEGAVLACSALKRGYRDRLRRAVPRLGFAYLRLEPAEAHDRVATRPDHFMPASLVESQFAALEPPRPDEPDVLSLDARRPVEALALAIATWRAHA